MRALLAGLLLATACGKSAPPSPSSSSSSAPAPGAAPRVEPYALALVYSGWEIWIGNDTQLPADDPSRFSGALKAIEAALDQADLSHTAPAGSQGLAVVYDDKVTVRVPLGPIAGLTGTALGTQKDYYNHKGLELVRGITAAVDQLEKAPAHKKHLIVVSDGNDTNNQEAGEALKALKQRAATLGIDVSSVIFKSGMSGAGNVMAKLTDHSTTSVSEGALTADLVHAIGHPGG
jgi:hypothetical protein